MSGQVLKHKADLIKRYFKKADVFLTVCTHRTIDIDVMTSIMSLAGETKHHFSWAPVRGDALISRARSRVASYFLLERNEDILMFIDDDVVFEPKDAVKLIDDVLSGCDIVGGMYVQKGTLDKTCVLNNGDTIKFCKNSKPQKVKTAATGFMAISRKVLKGMTKNLPEADMPLCNPGGLNYYPFFNPYPKKIDGIWMDLSEDWAFCMKAKDAGFDTWIDPSIFLQHKGEYLYDLADKVRPPKPDLRSLEITLK